MSISKNLKSAIKFAGEYFGSARPPHGALDFLGWVDNDPAHGVYAWDESRGGWRHSPYETMALMRSPMMGDAVYQIRIHDGAAIVDMVGACSHHCRIEATTAGWVIVFDLDGSDRLYGDGGETVTERWQAYNEIEGEGRWSSSHKFNGAKNLVEKITTW